jgi:hypothetical protein
MYSFTADVEWSNRGVGQIPPGVADAGACASRASTRLCATQLLMSGWISVLPDRLVIRSRDQRFTPIACEVSCSLVLMLNCLAYGGGGVSS